MAIKNSFMLEKLNTLKTILGNENFVLTGSMALAFHGLIRIEEAKDLDLRIINPSSTTKEILDRFQKENPNPKFVQGGSVNYSFLFEGVKVDVWLKEFHENNEYLLTKGGIQVASISSIVAAKLEIGRSKDWIHLMQLSRRIYDPARFEENLRSISNHSESYN